jgi:hypothetical protein
MEIFEGSDRHQAYCDWLTSHPTGFVLNVKSNMLHRAVCDHISTTGSNMLYFTNATKICSDHLDELRNAAQTKQSISNCQDCRP